MELDFEKSLTYIAKDPQWGNKLLAGSGLVLATFVIFLFPLLMLLTGSIPVVIFSLTIAMIASFAIWLIVSGYICKAVHLRITQPENDILPDWSNFGELFVTGAKYFFGYFLYVLPVCLTAFLCGFLFIFGTVSSASSDGSGAFAFLFVVLLGAITLFLYVLTLLFLPLMMVNFFKNRKVLSFVNLKQGYEMLKNNVGNYFILILLFIAVGMIGQLICSVLFATIVGIILLPILYFYMYLVIVELTAQFVISSEKETN